MARHLEQCETCRDLEAPDELDVLLVGPSMGHIPASVLARWTEAERTLRGVERELVRGHVLGCADCRNVLARLGFTPALSELPPRTEAASTDRTVRPLRRRPQVWTTIWAGLATAACLVLALRLSSLPPSRESEVVSVVTLVATRGESVNEVRIGRAQRFVALIPPTLPGFDSVPQLRIAVRAFDGREEFTVLIASRALANRGAIMVPTGALSSGPHEFVIGPPTSADQSVIIPFRVLRD